MFLARSQLTRALFLIALPCLSALISGCASREERIQELQSEANQALYADDSETAIAILRKGLAKYPDSNEIRISLSGAVQNAGELEEAATLLEQAVAQDPDADQLWVKIGELRSSLSQSEASIRAFESYLKNHGGDFLAWKSVALENEKLGKLTDAIKAANRWNEITPSSQPALKLGQLYLASRNIPQARSWFSQAAAYGDAYAAKEALAELIKLETSLKQFQQASIWLEQYAQRYQNDLNDPRIRESKTVLDNWQRARREIVEAAAALEKERDELEEKRLAEEKAAAERQSAELADALSSKQPALTQTDSDPDTPAEDPESNAEKAPLALFDDEEASAQSTSDDAPEESAQDDNQLSLSQYETAVAAYDSGDYDQAIPIFWDLLGENPNDAQVWFRLSQSYYQQQNWYDAESTILEAKRRAPRSEVIANQYLVTIRKTQNTTHVLEEIKALRLLFPRSPAIALTLAQTLRNANAPRSIVAAAYRDFIAISQRGDPGYNEANQYLQNNN